VRPSPVVAATTALLATLLGAEALLRTVEPNPRVQVIRPERFEIEVVGGVPLWTLPGDHGLGLRNEACEGDVHIVLAADSTLYVLGPGEGGRVPLPDDPLAASVGRQLQARLDRPDRRACVHNVSMPAYGPAQQQLAVERVLARHPAALVVFGVFKPDNTFTRVGESWYPFTQYETDAAGFPRPLGLALPTAVHEALLPRSRLYEYSLLALGTPDDDAYPIGAYEQFIDWSLTRRQPALLLEMPRLSMPFDELLARRPPEGHPRIEAIARARHFPYAVLAAHLQAHRPEELRTDTCCHYNADGHAVIASVLADLLAPMLP
jgi:hypothetical protein